MTTIAAVDKTGRHGGLVPLPELRTAMKLSPDAFDKLVLGARDDFKIDLKVAHSPNSIAPEKRAVGIWVQDKSRPWDSGAKELLYYAAVR